MKARLLKKLRKESKKLKLIRGEDYQYIVTDSPHDILRPKLDTYYSGTYYCGQELLFDEDVIAWLHNADVIGFCPRLNECVYICVNLELEYIKSNCFTKSY